MAGEGFASALMHFIYSCVLHSFPSFALIATQSVSLQVFTRSSSLASDVASGVGVPVDTPEIAEVPDGLTIKLVVVSFAAFVVKLQGAPSLLNSFSVPRT